MSDCFIRSTCLLPQHRCRAIGCMLSTENDPYRKVCVASSAEFVLLGPKWPFWFLTRTTRTIFTFVTTTRKRLQNLLIKTILQWRLMPSAGKTDLGVLSWQCWRWTKTEEIFSGWLKQIHKRVTLAGKTDPGVLGWQLPSNERGFCDLCELEPMGGCHVTIEQRKNKAII